jgi:hypothetical protein
MLEEVKIVAARDAAMRAVKDMPDNELKVRAFEVILGRLLDAEAASSRGVSSDEILSSKAGKIPRMTAVPSLRNKPPKSCSERIVFLREDGFFKGPRTLGEIRSELQVRGWTYPVTSLSGPMQKLVQKRELRRMPGQNGSYTYVAP